MVNNETGNQSDFSTDLKEGNEGNFGSNNLLQSTDTCLIDLMAGLKMEHEVSTSMYDRLFTKEVVLSNDKPDNFSEITVKYKSTDVTGGNINVIRTDHTIQKLNHELSKLNGVLSNVSAVKISDFIRKLVYQMPKDFIFNIDVGREDFYVSVTIYSPRDLQSVTIEIF